MVRKTFHVLAFVLFLPGIINAHFNRPRLMVFAFNCVSVALILIEALRFSQLLPHNFSMWFKRMSDGREKEPGTLIATHIYLLIGCAFPLCASFILTGGSVLTAEWTLWSCAGIVFLGIGDTCAAVLGK